MPTSLPPALPPGYVATRTSLHRIAVHVLARRRHAVTGRIGLRATPGGWGTPKFGATDREEVLRISGTDLLRERRDEAGTHTTAHAIAGATLGALARFAAVDLVKPFSVGHDTPEVGDAAAPLVVEPVAVEIVADWLHLGTRAIDAVVVALGERAQPSVSQLWPEHFDIGCDVAVGPTRTNLGVSLGDGLHAGPYAYVGPWSDDRPGNPAFWNAPFGALVGFDALVGEREPADAITGFFRRAVDLLGR